MPTFFQQLKAIFVLPVNVALIVPLFIVWFLSDTHYSWHIQSPFHYIIPLLAVLLLVIGLMLVYLTIRLFIKTGQGTILRWNPPERLIVEGPYRYVRNPMISGLIFILLGESLLLTSIGILGWTIFFFITHHFYLLYSEEPDLERRFGDQYRAYIKKVPRWLPRFEAWEGNDATNQ